jgi:hypothetical protein
MLYGLATGLAEALTVIHAAGVIHRDLKPSNVILTEAGPKVIDFGIAQALDGTSMTKTGMIVGSAGFMAPEQITGHPGPAADVFVWGVTVAYAAAGESPFGAGETHAILYRVIHVDPDIAGVPGSLRPLVAAALAKDPARRPTAPQLLGQLTTAPMRPQWADDSPTEVVLPRTWPAAGEHPSGPHTEDSLLLDLASPGQVRPVGARTRRISRRTMIGASALTVAALAVAVALAVLPRQAPRAGPSASEGGSGPPIAAITLPTYPGQLTRGVFQTIQRVAAWGSTMVTTGGEKAGGVIRQQFFASFDAGRTWQLAPVQAPGGARAPLGYQAGRIAGGPRGWLAEGPDAIWTSPDGRTWTLAARHGITPQQPGDSVDVVTGTPGGFLAAGTQTTSAGQQAVIWTSHDGLTWQRMTATQLGLLEAGAPAGGIDFATSRGADTLIANRGSGVWLSTDSGSRWTQVTVPVDHGAQDSISGVSFDGSGLVVVRPGRTPGGSDDGVAYFSPDGQTWQYAGTIDAAGGWSPDVVKGSNYGFVVTGHTASQYVAYTGTGSGTIWLPTGPLGATSGGPPLTPVVGPGGSVVAAGNTNPGRTSQLAFLVKADTAGDIQPVSPAALPGGLIPEEAVTGMAAAPDGGMVAVGSADGYPAVWQSAAGDAWRLVSSQALVSADPDLAGLSAVTHGPSGWLAVGTGPFVLTSGDGTHWQFAGTISHDLAGVSAVQAASGPGGYVIVGKVVEPRGACLADVWWSPDLASWTKAREVNETSCSRQVLTVAAGPSRFVSAGSYEGKPAAWTNSDGRTWTTVHLALPPGASAGVIQQVAVSGSRVVALGQQTTADGTSPLAERSGDGGRSWQLVPFPAPGPAVTFTALTAGPGGFIAAAQFGSASGGLDAAVWTSAEGQTWTRSAVSGLAGGSSHAITALAASGDVVTGIDSAETQAGQQFVLRRLPAA